MKRRTVLIIGGTGEFGSRLAEGVCATSQLNVVIAGRNLDRGLKQAENLRARFPDRQISAVRVDTARLTPEIIRKSGAWVVVDAAGPFQRARPKVAEAAIAARCHYVDLADARDFVAQFPQLDASAHEAGVLAVTGASTTPALTQAVLDQLVSGWLRIDLVEGEISPGNQQPRGLSVVKAILEQVGQPVRIWRENEWRKGFGWSMLVRQHMEGLGERWLSLVETPDLDIIPARFPVREAVFRAGLELSIMHLGLSALGMLVRLRMLPSLLPFAAALWRIATTLQRFGSDRGGMSVRAKGIDAEGRPVVAEWALIAEQGDGPHIPVLPALALIKALISDDLKRTGAMPCVGLLNLENILVEFSRLHITTRNLIRLRNVFPQVLAGSFDDLPQAIRNAHLIDRRHILTGRASVTGAPSAFGRIMAWVFGFPKAALDVPVSVEMVEERGGEIWRREIGTHVFKSRLSLSRLNPDVILERFGLFTFELKATAGPTELTLETVGWCIGPLRLPRLLAPRSRARETVDDQGRFEFDVPIFMPGIGLIVHYRGWLQSTAEASSVKPLMAQNDQGQLLQMASE